MNSLDSPSKLDLNDFLILSFNTELVTLEITSAIKSVMVKVRKRPLTAKKNSLAASRTHQNVELYHNLLAQGLQCP